MCFANNIIENRNDACSNTSLAPFIVGAVVAAVVVVIVIFIVSVVVIRRRFMKQQKAKDAEMELTLQRKSTEASLSVMKPKSGTLSGSSVRDNEEFRLTNITIEKKLGAGNFGDVYKGIWYGAVR